MEYDYNYYEDIVKTDKIQFKQTNDKFIKLVKKMENYKNIMKKGYEFRYKFIKLYKGNDPEIECSALTNQYLRCGKPVLYTIDNLNEDGEKFKYKKKVPLCKNHTKQIVESDNKKTLRYGFYYESDLYFKKN